ncbi:MAG: hypothetical protein JJ866_15540 [Roseibium sp.]|uniref:hypothetical protein n=1 Tax=Roseibium sp. TaxID=1936156 RepID=UPI001B2123DF|nr:hypothetical protein [Roseibium sp.]MBO6511479.1 hypothetical protein [Roseibium sp.]MBO6893357.1 hypothetical protein [Roseibium sp.]MBO6933119.1 hypothetical protein [Roseibium sp.]
MPFTRLGTFIAGVAFILGCIQIALAIGVGTGAISEPRPGLFLGGYSSEQAIDSGLMKVLAAVAFGVLTEISRSVERK